MFSLRSSASSAPRSPLATAASAAFSKRSFSDAGNRRRLLGGVLSTAAPLTPTSRGLRSLSGGEISGSTLRDGLGTCEAPFSALQYRDIQRELSHATLAQRGVVLMTQYGSLLPGSRTQVVLPTHGVE